MNMNFIRKLPIPMDIKAEFPLSAALAARKEKNDKEIADIFTGKSDRLALIIGPCSADREDAVIEYIYRLRALQEKVADKILIIPRVYTNKPRTTGDGYKGMLHQPNPNEAPDLLRGIIAIRKIHIRAIEETEFSCADEMLYPENYRYLSDILSYVAVGARSVENQQHRLTASGLDIPVGLKNPTSGDTSVLINSITAAQHSHAFLYRGWEVQTQGNPLAHAILRGYVDKRSTAHPNYHYEDLRSFYNIYTESGLANASVIIDTNHANSGKHFEEQPRIVKEVLHSRNQCPDVKRMLKGFMIESYLEDGAQKIGPNCVYGQSITDPCLGWEKTERLVLEMADLI